MYKVLLIGAGGFIGTVSRYLSQQLILKLFDTMFPLATMTVNIIGSFIIGIIYGISENNQFLTPDMRLFLAVGFCGGFTTFSSFAYESLGLFRNNPAQMMIYMGSSVIVGLIAAYLGLLLIKPA